MTEIALVLLIFGAKIQIDFWNKNETFLVEFQTLCWNDDWWQFLTVIEFFFENEQHKNWFAKSSFTYISSCLFCYWQTSITAAIFKEPSNNCQIYFNQAPLISQWLEIPKIVSFLRKWARPEGPRFPIEPYCPQLFFSIFSKLYFLYWFSNTMNEVERYNQRI